MSRAYIFPYIAREAMHGVIYTTQGWGILTIWSFNSEWKLPCKLRSGFCIFSLHCKLLYSRKERQNNHANLYCCCEVKFSGYFPEVSVSSVGQLPRKLLAHAGFTVVIHGVTVPTGVAVLRNYGQTCTALQVTWIQGACNLQWELVFKIHYNEC